MKQNSNQITAPVEVILASASPRRAELLKQIGIEAEIIPSEIEENVTAAPADMVEILSRQKAEEVAGRISSISDTVPHLVIGADTVVTLNGSILGKPADRSEAHGMLTQLQGNQHYVYTGVTLIMGERKRTFFEETMVEVYPMTAEEIHTYLDKGESMDKAGAYGIQGPFAAYIKRIKGSYTNVVGLPVGRLYQELKQMQQNRPEGQE